ncbi:MAG TPA: sigma-70 family RNA polymerase sigma factor [Polyangiaceae bacterium]
MARSSASTRRLRVVSGGRQGGGFRSEALESTAALDDAQLVALARAADLRAFEALYRRHAGFALNLAVRIQGSGADAEDIVHDAFLRVHQRLRELRDGHLFRAWLGSIVVRLVRTRLRRRRLMALFGIRSSEPVDLDSLATPEASPEARAELAQVYALLQTMAPQDRIAWTLRHIERHRLDAVAELSGCSLATAKRRIQRAQHYLRDHFVAPFEQDERRD